MDAMEVLKSLNLHKTDPARFRGARVSPRDVVAAVAPDPSELCKRLVGITSSGTWVKGTKDGLEREVYLYQLADAEEVLGRLGTQVITAQTAFTASSRWRCWPPASSPATGTTPRAACARRRSSAPTRTWP